MAGGDHGGVRSSAIGGQLRPLPVPVTRPYESPNTMPHHWLGTKSLKILVVPPGQSMNQTRENQGSDNKMPKPGATAVISRAGP